MSKLDTFCLEPDYSRGVSGWANSSTNDQWVTKNRGGNVVINNTTLFSAGLHPNRDEPHGVWYCLIPYGVNVAVYNDRGYSIYWQCVN